jgi:hypothetical protein
MGVMPLLSSRMAAIADDAKPIDLLIPTYTAEEAFAELDKMGEEGREAYKQVEIYVDIIYPIIYGIGFSLIVAFLWGKGEGSPIFYFPLLPYLIMLFDFGENYFIVSTINDYSSRPSDLLTMGSYFSLVKWSGLFVLIPLMLAGVVKKWVLKK